MNLLPFDYLGDAPDHVNGLVAIAPLIAVARATCGATLLCDTGDFLQGTPLADEIADRQLLPHPMIETFNALRYDVVTLGNHDFDYGLPYLQAALRDATAHVVSANLRTGPTSLLVAPWVIIDRIIACSDGISRLLRVGLIGFAPPQIEDWAADVLQGAVQTDDIVSAARTHLPQLRRAGADIVVALCHGGPAAGPAMPRMENAALALAALPGVDAVLMGHMHATFPGAGFNFLPDVNARRATIGGKPALMAGSNGQSLGQLDIMLAATQGGGWRVTDGRACILTPSLRAARQALRQTPLAQSLRSTLAPHHAATLERLRQPVSHAPVRLTSYLAAIGLDDTAGLLAQVQIDAIRADLRGGPYADLPVLASTAPFRAGGHGGPDHYLDIAAGPLLLRDCAAMVPFDNSICAVLRRGWQVRAWLERSSGFFQTLTPGQPDQPLLNPHVAPYHFDSLHGVSYVIDLHAPGPGSLPCEAAPGRITELTWQGVPVDDDALFIVATSTYRARGGGNLIVRQPSDTVHVTTTGLRDLLRAALRSGTAVATPQPGQWTFAPMPGTTALFPVSPRATEVLSSHTLHGVPRVTATNTAADPDGFATCRLHL